MGTEAELLIDRVGGGVVILALNRPDRMNAITTALQRELDVRLTALEADPDVRCLVLTGAGEAAFSAGYDVHEMAWWSADELAQTLREREPWIWHIAATPLPLVAAINGVAYGAGAIIATAADVRIASPGATFRFTAATYGGANATWSLPSLIGRGRAAEVLMTARVVDAEEAERIGLVNRIVPVSELIASAVASAREIAANPSAGVRAIKRLLREHEGRSIEDRFVAENDAMQTELKPRPVGELYEEFLDEDA
jgi:enoyl-CoA hydratase/carnithine racemase